MAALVVRDLSSQKEEGSLMFKRSTLACLLLALVGIPAFAQMTVTGTMTGTIIDPSGQVIAGAKVTAVSENTGDTRSATTSDLGVFHLVALPPGSYSLKVEHS